MNRIKGDSHDSCQNEKPLQAIRFSPIAQNQTVFVVLLVSSSMSLLLVSA